MVILKDTSLCAIVRDEMMNPAGGIERFIRSIVPNVEQAVILDTGSVDGTREKLDQLQKEFPQMRVYDRSFDNYVRSRNASLDKVETKWILILDADELITQENFETTNNVLLALHPKIVGVNFPMETVSPDYVSSPSFEALHNPRLFLNKPYFRYRTCESTSFSEYLFDFLRILPKRVDESWSCLAQSPVPIQHFVPNSFGIQEKLLNWYGWFGTHKSCQPNWKLSPCHFPGFKDWKKYNPQRDLYA